MQFTELLPMQAKIADKFTVLRSMRQTAPGHPAGSMQMLSGDPDTRDKPKPQVSRLDDGDELSALTGWPTHQSIACLRPASIRHWEYNGPAYLGDAYSPFTSTETSAPSFSVPNIGLSDKNEFNALRGAPRCAKSWIRSVALSINLGNLAHWINLNSKLIRC